MLKFSNPGTLDPRLIITFGANVKDNPSAIGFFGTGLKYAIAVVLRLGGKICIQSNDSHYKFSVEPCEIRGKQFSFITMNGQQVGFTTELGKTWEPWMAYRELVCNARDENGCVEQQSDSNWPQISRGITGVSIYVICPELEIAHQNQHEYFIMTKPFCKTLPCEIHNNISAAVFYRGVQVGKLPKPAQFTYNILEQLDLTEDRTAKSLWGVTSLIARAIAASDNTELHRRVLLADEQFFEHSLDFRYATASPQFLTSISNIKRNNIRGLNKSARDLLAALEPETNKDALTVLTAVEQEMLNRSIQFLTKFGLQDLSNFKIVVYNSLGKDILGTINGTDEIWLSRRAFQIGTKCVCGTILEEYIHLVHGHADETRSMQNHLIDWLISIGEEKIGHPL